MSHDPADEIVAEIYDGSWEHGVRELIRRAVAAGRELGLEEAERLKSAAILRWNATEPNREMFWQDRGAASERAAIVAWLRDEWGYEVIKDFVSADLMAQLIEAGEHLKWDGK